MAAAHDNNWMPLYIGDYLRDTSRLTTEEHGAYLLLIMDYWVNGPPPDNDRQLAAIVKASPHKWKNLRKILGPFFKIREGYWRQKRIDAERAHAGDLTEQKRRAGLASAESRRARDGTAQPNTRSNTVRVSVRTQAQPQSEGYINNLKGYLGSACASARAREEPSDGGFIALDELVEVVRGTLQPPRNGVHDPVAYRDAIRCNKRERWHNNLAVFVGESLPGGIGAKMPAWEAIETSRACGCRAATPPEIRRAVDQLSRLRQSQQQHAEAAE
ncbi:MAG TPA: YdaU family protein [Xanthobacteraceae bacterium]|nr:YdaU family protein [Xanthobacteraceae bacterium]